MVCLCDKKGQTAIFGQRRWHQTTTARKQMIYSVSGRCLKIKMPFGLRTRKRQLEPRVLLELPLLVSDVRNLKEVDLSSPTGAKREPFKYVESFD